MTELLTAAQMRAIEQEAIEAGKVTGLALMERAGQGVVDAIFAEWPQLGNGARSEVSTPDGAEREASLSRSPKYLEPKEDGSRRAVVLCGPGNNGGDGFVVARILVEAGWAVEVFLYGGAEKLPPDARANCEKWRELGGVADWDDDTIEVLLAEGDCDLVIDALFGIGLSRPMPHDTRQARRGMMAGAGTSEVNSARPRCVAIDVPSGLCADSGRDLGGAFPADLTVTFHEPKVGHYVDPRGGRCDGGGCGKVVVVDIGLQMSREHDRVQLLSRPSKLGKKDGHKYTHGHALVLSGGVGKGGAARLAARGALRVGAGAVTVGCPPAALIENAAQLNAVMLQRVADAEGLAELLADRRLNTLCVGPGLGLGAREAALVKAACEQAHNVVFDADALTLLAQDVDLFGALHEGCVLTPHSGEFARMFPDIAAKLDAPAVKGPAYSKVDATREAARRAGCVVLFKGPDTVIADPQGRCGVNASVYARAAPWLATAGSGDVLAGFITGLMARGFGPMQAAEAGAWLHTECALQFGPGLIAEDLPEQLPAVLRKLGVT